MISCDCLSFAKGRSHSFQNVRAGHCSSGMSWASVIYPYIYNKLYALLNILIQEVKSSAYLTSGKHLEAYLCETPWSVNL